MLNVVVHYPCPHPININESVVCGDWPQMLKREIIKGAKSICDIREKDSLYESGDFITDENLFVLVKPVIEDLRGEFSSFRNSLGSPVLVIVYVGFREKKIISWFGERFNDIVRKSLRSTFLHKSFSVHYIAAVDSFVIPYE